MKKEIDRHRDRRWRWWQDLSASNKALFITGIVLVAVVLLVYYFVSMAGSPETVAKVMVAVCALETVFMVAAAVICTSINTANMNEIKDKAIEMMEAEIDQAKQFYLDAQEDSLKIMDLDWEDWENPEDAKQPSVVKQPPTTAQPVAQLSAEQITDLRKESENYDPEKDTDMVVERRYKRAEVKHNSDTNREKVPRISGGVTVAFPVKARTSEPESKTNPDPPEKEPSVRSIEEQLDELHLPPTATTFLRYLLQVGGCKDYTELKPALRGQLDTFISINAS